MKKINVSSKDKGTNSLFSQGARAVFAIFCLFVLGGSAWAQTAATPVLSPTTGASTVQFNVTLTDSTGGATIYYTLDGNAPTTSSSSVSSGGTVFIAQSETLKAMAVASGYSNSAVASATYITAAVTAGWYHTISLKNDGTVWSWGLNSSGQLGNNSTTQQNSAVQVLKSNGNGGTTNLTNITAISSGAYHNLALDSSGNVWAWGLNSNGQVGDNTTTQRNYAVQVQKSSGGSTTNLTNIVAICSGAYHNLALDSSGNVWAWGLNSSGQLGDNSTTQQNMAEQLTTLSGVTVQQLAAGAYHSMLLTTGSTIEAWGLNSSGQVGDGTTTQRNSPVSISGPTGITSIAGGQINSLALENDGSVWAWGAGGSTGDGTSTQQKSPELLTTISGVTGLGASSGQSSCFVVKSDGTAWSWGYDNYGELGNGTVLVYGSDSPVQMTGVVSGAVAVAAGEYHTMVLKNDGTLYGVGFNDYTQLGNGYSPQNTTPVQLLTSDIYTAIAADSGHNLLLRYDGTVWAMGDNAFGDLGDGTITESDTPVQVGASTMGFTDITAISAGVFHNLALDSTGKVWAWGWNSASQLGIGADTEEHTPVQAGASTLGFTSITSVIAGYTESFALKNDGTVWAWGDNTHGQLGDGTTTWRSSPVQLSGVSGITSLSAGGYYHVVALKNDGTVWTWGYNSNGQLGDGTTTEEHSPEKVTALVGTTIVAVRAGLDYSMALDSSGNIWVWGINSNDQLGDGTATEQHSPEELSITGVRALGGSIGGNNYSSAVFKTDGTLWGWGPNFSGELGLGNTTAHSSPTQLTGFNGLILAAAGGQNSSLFLKGDGHLEGAGSDYFGTLGSAAYAIPLAISGFNALATVPTPTVSITAPSNNATVNMYTTQTFTASASETGGTIASVSYYINSTLVGTSTTGSSFSITWTPPTWGDYTFTAVATDASGNTSYRSSPITVQVPWVDTDSDSLPDWWETHYFGTLSYGDGDDVDLSGFNLLSDFEGGADPTNYYSRPGPILITPTLSIVSGNNQTSFISAFAPQALVVQVLNSATPMVNAPITFTVTSGGGMLATTNTGSPTLSTTINAITNSMGQVSVYYQQPSSAGASSVTATTGGQTVTFTETSLSVPPSGLVAWFEADAGITLDGSGNVSQWNDQSGNGNNAVQSSSGNRPTVVSGAINGKPALGFTSSGSSYMQIPNSGVLNPSQVTVITVSKRTSGTGFAAMVSQDNGTTYPYYIGYYGAGPVFYVNSGAVSINGSSTGGAYSVTEGVYNPSSGTASQYINGTATNSSYSAMMLTNSSPLYLGGTSSGYSIDGQIAEVLVYNTALNDIQRHLVEAYLYAKYGVGTQPSAPQPVASPGAGTYSGTQSVTLTPGQPGDTIYYTTDGSTPTTGSTLYTGAITISSTTTLKMIETSPVEANSPVESLTYTIDSTSNFTRTGMVAWFRADVGTPSSGTVSQWNDQSGNGNNAVQSSSGNQPTVVSGAINGKPALGFTSSGSSYMQIPNSGVLNPSQVTVITVSKRTSGTGFAAMVSQDNGTTYPYYIGYYGAGPVFYVNSGAVSINGSSTGGAYSVTEGVYNPSSGTASQYINGTATNSSYSAMMLTNSSPLYLGGTSSGYSMDGQIAEVLVYNTALTNLQRQQVEAYLYQRYGVGVDPAAPQPASSLAQGTYSGTQSVTLTPGQPGDTIYYTTDGSTPTTGSMLYTGAITISSTTTLKIIETSTNEVNSAVESLTYTIDSTSNFIRTGLVAWFRADVGAPSSGAVAQWNDQSGNGNNAVQSTGGNQPTVVSSAINGKPALVFNSANSTTLTVFGTSALNPSQVTVIAVAKRTGGSYYAAIASQFDGSNYPYWTGFTTGGSSNPEFILNGGVGADFTGTLSGGSYGVLEYVYNTSAHLASLYVNDSLSNSTSCSATLISNTAPLSIGSEATGSAEVLDGQIAELLIYNAALTDLQRKQVEAYLYQKYALGTQPTAPQPVASPGAGTYSGTQSVTLTPGQPGDTIYYTTDGSTPTTGSMLYTGAITISSTTTLKIIETSTNEVNSAVESLTYTIDSTSNFIRTGLVAWFRADVGAPSSGAVAQWNDQSGNGNNAVQSTGGNQPTVVSSAINGKPALVFNSANSTTLTVFGTSALNPSQVTVIAVAKRTGGSYYAAIASQFDGSNYPYWTGFTTGGSSNPEFILNGGVGADFTGTLSGGSYGVLEYVYNTSAHLASLYVNDSLSNSTSCSATLISNTAPLSIGSEATGSAEVLDGQIAELLIYNTALTDLQRKQVEAYLYQKYALGTQPTAPQPVASPGAGTYSGTQSVTLTPGQPGDTIYYTTDGSTPTTGSMLYTGAITISSTTTLKIIETSTNEINSSVENVTYTIH